MKGFFFFIKTTCQRKKNVVEWEKIEVEKRKVKNDEYR